MIAIGLYSKPDNNFDDRYRPIFKTNIGIEKTVALRVSVVIRRHLSDNVNSTTLYDNTYSFQNFNARTIFPPCPRRARLRSTRLSKIL